MKTIFALIVGIDTYRAVAPLRGCRNDAVEALGYLRSRTGDGSLQAIELHNDKATRGAIVDGIQHHLGQAGPGDTALFWFAGHGSQAPIPRELWHSEPGGLLQTLVCADSRDGDVPDLYDKELSVLLDRVAANGCHVAVVLDSCHSAGATRGAVPEPAALVRHVPPAHREPRPADLIPELRDGWAALPERSRHVLLAACRSDQLATELPMDGPSHGVFSWALLRALNDLGPGATYRELLAAARCAVEDRVQFQTPRLTGDVAADQPFLGGRLRHPSSGITMRHVHGRWEIDAGSCHGVPPAVPGPLRVAVAENRRADAARVTSVLVDRSIVEPDGWVPDRARQYQVIFTKLPRPALTVAVDGPAGDLAELADGSPYLRVARPGEPGVPDLRFHVAEPGRARILGADGLQLTPDIVDDPGRCAHRTVRAGEHIARWRQVRALANPASPLAGGVRMEIVPARPGERTAPLDRPPLAPGADGLVRLRYRRESGGWIAPTVFIRLHNTMDRPLYCVLLDLTGRYRIHAGLFRGEFIGARLSGAALNGRPVQFRLPDGSTPAPGREIRDWLKLIVAEDEFSFRPFEQPSLDDPARRGVPAPVSMTRDAGAGDSDGAYDWTSAGLGVVTVVPDQ